MPNTSCPTALFTHHVRHSVQCWCHAVIIMIWTHLNVYICTAHDSARARARTHTYIFKCLYTYCTCQHILQQCHTHRIRRNLVTQTGIWHFEIFSNYRHSQHLFNSVFKSQVWRLPSGRPPVKEYYRPTMKSAATQFIILSWVQLFCLLNDSVHKLVKQQVLCQYCNL